MYFENFSISWILSYDLDFCWETSGLMIAYATSENQKNQNLNISIN